MFVQINEKLGLSPGEFTIEVGKRIDLARKRKKRSSSTPAAKKARSQKKMHQTMTNVRQEVKEGPTYGSNIGFEGMKCSQ